LKLHISASSYLGLRYLKGEQGVAWGKLVIVG